MAWMDRRIRNVGPSADEPSSVVSLWAQPPEVGSQTQGAAVVSRVPDWLKCRLGLHTYKVSKFVWLGAAEGERDAFCVHCRKYKAIPADAMMEARK